MAVKINLGLLKKDLDTNTIIEAPKPEEARPTFQEEPPMEKPAPASALHVEPEKPKMEDLGGGFVLGREDDESFHANEHKFEGANAEILSTPVRSSFEMPSARPAEAAPAEEASSVQSQPIRVFCVGGNENYYRNVLESLNSSTPDIKFVKYLPSDDNLTLMAIESMNPDIVLVYWKTPTVDAQRFWDSICNDNAEDGVAWRDKFANKRLVVIIPNDISCEIRTRELGLFFIVRETNPQRHEVSIDALIDQIRIAYGDIEQASVSDAPVEQPVQEEVAKAEPVSNEACVQEPEVQEQPNQSSIVSEQPVEQEDVQSAPKVQVPPVEQQPASQPKVSVQHSAPQMVAPEPEMVHSVREQPQYQEAPADTGVTPMQRKLREIERDQEQPSRIIGVYSVTGGAGTTTCATNLAAVLSKFGNNEVNDNYRVALLEYNLSCQCVDIFFNFKGGEKNICQLAKSISGFTDEKGVVRISPEEMRPYIEKMVSHDDRTGLDILLGLSIPLEFDYIRDGFTKSLFAALRTMYDVVIVDLSSDMAKAPILDALYDLDQIYYIMPMDVASIRNTQQVIPVLKDLFRFSPDRIKLILNKVVEDNKEFDVEQVFTSFRSLECEPEGTIPCAETELVSSLNRGAPIAIENPDHPVSQALYSIAVGINPMMEISNIGATEEEPKKKGFFARLFGGGKKKKKDKDKAKKGKRGEKERPAKKERPRKVEDEALAEEPIEAEEELMDEEKPKKKGFFARLFGGGKKKKKDKKGKRGDVEERPRKKAVPKDEPADEPDVSDEDVDSVDEKPKKKGKGGFFAKIAGLFGGGGKKVKVKKKKKNFGGLLDKGEGDDDGEDVAEQPRQSRLVSRRRRPMARG